MVSTADAREWLRIDGTDNDAMISALVGAAVDYIEAATGLDAGAQADIELCDNAVKFLVSMWYYGESADVAQLSTIVDSLMKSITTLAVVGSGQS